MKTSLAQVKTDSIIMSGPTVLSGIVTVQGSKNAALPILSTLPLLPSVELYNVPDLSDTRLMFKILIYLGATGSFEEGVMRLDFKNIKNKTIDSEFSSKMRASSLFLGPLISKFGSARVGLPGGCVIGSRPLDIHLEGFQKLGYNVTQENGEVYVDGNNISGHYTLPFPSVGATQNLISSAVLSNDIVHLHNIAIEPEVVEMIEFLNKAGAKIELKQDKSVKIVGVKELNKVSFEIQPDRIEAFTLLTAALASKGSIKIVNVRPDHLDAPLQALAQMGAEDYCGPDYIKVAYVKPLKGIKVTTDVYPGFPTDCQQQISVLMLTATTPSLLTEKVFNSRFKHLDELVKMGANIQIENNVAVISPSKLTGCKVDSYDLRGAASMIMAGLISSGYTSVTGLRYLHRGYETYVDKLTFLGAKINFS